MKEEARKRDEVISVDTLHQRLIHLDEAAQSAKNIKSNWSKHYRAVLGGFCHLHSINTPELCQLVLAFHSSPEENAVLEKEQKFMKGKGGKKGEDADEKGAAKSI